MADAPPPPLPPTPAGDDAVPPLPTSPKEDVPPEDAPAPLPPPADDADETDEDKQMFSPDVSDEVASASPREPNVATSALGANPDVLVNLQKEKQRRATLSGQKSKPWSPGPSTEERFLSDKDNVCQICHKSGRALYCHMCSLELCLSCSISSHDTEQKKLHKRVPLAKREQYLEALQDPTSKESKEVESTKSQIAELDAGAPPPVPDSDKQPDAAPPVPATEEEKEVDATAQQAAFRKNNRKFRLSFSGALFAKPKPKPPKVDPSDSLPTLTEEAEDAADFNAVDFLGDALQSTAPASVFISYSQCDKKFVKQLHLALTTAGRKVWVDWENTPPAGVDWAQHIYHGILHSDIIVYVISPDSMGFEVCNMELDYAAKAGKRIVPVVARDVDYHKMRADIGSLDWVFFTEDNAFEDSLKVLRKKADVDLDHLRVHTTLLCRAMEWKNKNFDVSMLLSGKDIKIGRKWLFDSAQGQSPHPTRLVLGYLILSLNITTSIHLPKTEQKIAKPISEETASVFMCFDKGADDVAFAQKMVAAFQAEKRKVWVEWEHHEASPSWLTAVHRAIEETDAFVFVITPESLKNEQRQWEMDHAVKCGKRIIPVLRREVDPQDLRAELADMRSWIFIRQNVDEMGASMKLLRSRVDTTIQHCKFHTKLLQQTVAWIGNGKATKKLINEDDMQAATDWFLESALGKSPKPTNDMVEYFQASEKHFAACVIL